MPDGWGSDTPEPTNLIVPWPAAETCDVERLGHALAEALSATVDLTPVPAPADEIRLAAVLESEPLAAPAAVWIEAARGPLPGELVGSGPQPASVLGLETALPRDDPAAHYAALLGMLGRLAPPVPAVLDVNTGLWRGRVTLTRQFGVDATGPPDDALWIVQTIGPDAAGVADAAGACWLRTVGLRRCGRPELELLEVPPPLVATATTLLGAVAAMLLDQPSVPAPGAVFEIGPDLRITLQPADEVAAFVTPGHAGSPRHRSPDAPRSAALCDPTPRGVYRPIWTWPRDVIERLDRGETAVFRTARSAERQRRAARATWPRLLPVLARLDETLVHASVDQPGGEQVTWLRVTGVDADAVRGDDAVRGADAVRGDDAVCGKLLHRADDHEPIVVRRDTVNDWLARVGDRVFGPDDIDALETATRETP